MKSLFKKVSLFIFSVFVFLLVSMPQAEAATFTKYQADLRDGTASVGNINDGDTTHNGWKWLISTATNISSGAGAPNTNYATTRSVGIYDYSTYQPNNYLELTLPSDYPTGSYFIYVYGTTYDTNNIGFRVDDGTIVNQNQKITNSWYNLGQFSLTKDSKLRFSRTLSGGGVNLLSIQIKPMNSVPTNIPTGQEGIIKDFTIDTVLGAPTTLKATAGNAKVSLNWTASTGATSYNIKRATTAGGPYTTVATNVYGSPYTDTTVTNGTTYYYVVTAVNAGGESGNSNEASATPQGSVTPPTGSGNRALLVITLVSGLEKEYDLPIGEVNNFITWYTSRAAGIGPEVFAINKLFNKASFLSRTDNIAFDKIETFEVNEYEAN
ncbi:hypothetical protein OB236_23825 [Paenibacillus sp. WQ 127069]|uniref:Fibronectin type-III domain-containing protein n=1 Tax=Paenibacillus baimaensis TaxID=2982185 RepID=A0ABT2UKG5_9BACL|nr:hypothetical protein [Paenibacillus sp. WQ 127069]MCU6795140.1 hypothetical protein [Paenibacillus sp. WQ 127069]